MKTVRRYLLFAVFASSFSCSRSAQDANWKLEVSSSAASTSDGQNFKIEVKTGETTVVELLVVGTAPGSVQFSASGLPSFGMLQGPMLKFRPARQDAGEYEVTVTATSNEDSQSAILRLVVPRPNNAPIIPFFGAFYDDHGRRGPECPGIYCTLDGLAQFQLEACDLEGDAMTFEVEVVRAEDPFANVPTYSASVPRSSPGACPSVMMPLAGLTLEQRYKMAFRISDEFGGVAQSNESPDGWWGVGPFPYQFDQGPCTTRQCACSPSGQECGTGAFVCCSRVCDQSAIPPRCQ